MKIVIVRVNGESIDIKLETEDIEQVNGFKYLGSCITHDMLCTKYANIRITVAKQVFNRKQIILWPTEQRFQKNAGNNFEK